LVVEWEAPLPALIDDSSDLLWETGLHGIGMAIHLNISSCMTLPWLF